MRPSKRHNLETAKKLGGVDTPNAMSRDSWEGENEDAKAPDNQEKHMRNQLIVVRILRLIQSRVPRTHVDFVPKLCIFYDNVVVVAKLDESGQFLMKKIVI